MMKQYESPNIDNSSDEKSSSSFISRRVLDRFVEQASPSWINHVRNNGDQVLADDDTRINVTKCNNLFKTETMNLLGSSATELSPTELDATEISRSNKSKSALELLQYLQECIQKINSEFKNDEKLIKLLDVAMDTISNYINKLDTLHIQKLAKRWLEIRNNLIYDRQNFRKGNSDSTTNSSKSSEESKDYQNKEKENRETSQKIDKLPSFRSTDASVKNLEVENSINSMTNIHDITYIPSTSITNDQPETTDNKEYLDPVNSAELISTPKYALVLKSQSSQECIQKIESDNKSKNYEGSYSMESFPAESSCMDQLNASNRICEHVLINKAASLRKQIDIYHAYNEFLLLIFDADLCINYKKQVPRENNSDNTTETYIEASPNQTNYIRNNEDQVLVDDTRRNITKCNYLFKPKPMNLSGSSTTKLSPTELDADKIARSKSAQELLQYLHECVQKIKSESKNKESKKLLDVTMNMILDYINKLDILRIQKLSEKWLEIRNDLIYGRRNFRKRNSDGTTNSSKSDEESKDYQNKGKKNCEMSQKIDELPSFRSTDVSVKNLEVEKSIDPVTNIHDISSTSIIDDQPEITDNKEYLDPVNSAELISTPKYALKLKSRSPQECIQKIESDKKSKIYEDLYLMESLADSFYMDQSNTSNRICELLEYLSETIDICHVYNQLLFLRFEAYFYIDNVRKNNSDSMTETSVEQTSPSRTDYVRGQILVDNDAGTNVAKCNYSSETKSLNLPESSTTEPSTTESFLMESSGTESNATEIARPSTSKSALELKSQSSQECTQKKDNNYKSKENQDKCQVINMRAKESTDSTANIHDNTSDLPALEPADNQAEVMNDKKFVNLEEFKITSISKDKSLWWIFINMKLKFNFKTLIILFRILLTILLIQLVIKIIIKIASKYMIINNKALKNKKTEDIQDTDVKICRKKCFTYLKCFIILLILILFLFLCIFLFYFHFRPVSMDEDDMHIDTFATTVVELEGRVLDHDATIRVLTEYLERDTPSLKVVALIGETSVDKPYTVDIIKKGLCEKRSNSSSPLLSTFIVLENLRTEHSKVVINYVNMYQEAYGDRQFTILAVFKVEQIDDDLTRADINHVINTVKDIFIEANIIMKIIPFKPLSEDTLEKYIRNTAKNIGQTFSQDQIDHYKRRLIENDTDCQRKYVC